VGSTVSERPAAETLRGAQGRGSNLTKRKGLRLPKGPPSKTQSEVLNTRKTSRFRGKKKSFAVKSSVPREGAKKEKKKKGEKRKNKKEKKRVRR